MRIVCAVVWVDHETVINGGPPLKVHERYVMTVEYSQAVQNSRNTRIICLNTTSDTPWVVCTMDAVPVILARFSSHTKAKDWQTQLCHKRTAA